MPVNHSNDAYRRRIKEFVDVFLATMGATSAPGVPDDMRVGPVNQYGWSAWQPVPSTITDKEIAAIEQFIGVTLPPLFHAYLTYQCLLMTDFGLLSLPEIRSDCPLEGIKSYLNLLRVEPYWREHGYVPFGQPGNGSGPLCFDTRRPNGEGDYPIMYVDREHMRQFDYAGTQKWDSFAHLLDDLQDYLLSFKRMCSM